MVLHDTLRDPPRFDYAHAYAYEICDTIHYPYFLREFFDDVETPSNWL
jgi:hypothetical protein